MKKFVGSILILCLMGLNMGVYAGASDPGNFSDIDKTDDLYTIACRLGSLKVEGGYPVMGGYPDGTFGEDRTLTRAEMTVIAAKLRNLYNEEKMDTGFSDVPADYWASGAIKTAQQMGLVSGNDDGTFCPDEKVTYEQAVKMVVTALGYEPMAKTKGGYPTGYLMTANQIGILKDAPSNRATNESITRGDVAKILNKALNGPLMEQIGFGAVEEYAVCDGTKDTRLKTLETQYFVDSNIFFLDMDNNIILSNKDIVMASAECDKEGEYYYLKLKLNDSAKEKFAAATEKLVSYKNDKNTLKVVYCGEIVSKPRVTEKIDSGEVRITGEFKKDRAEEMAKSINEDLKKDTDSLK